MTTILVVDDHSGIRLALRAVLEEAGYDVAEAADAEDLQDTVERLEPDLILLDVALQRTSGFQALRQLRQSASLFKSVPVIMVSGRDEAESLQVALDHGANDYIIKPWARGEVERRVKLCLSQSGRG